MKSGNKKFGEKKTNHRLDVIDESYTNYLSLNLLFCLTDP